MKARLTLTACAVLLASSVALAQEASEAVMPEMPPPAPENEWLQQFVGEWDVTMHCQMEGMPEMNSVGVQKVRSLGGYWVLSEIQSEIMGSPWTGLQTLGYDQSKGKYIGTWVDSSNGFMWRYEGELNEAGDALVLMTEGPYPMKDGEMTPTRETLRFESDDRMVYTSEVQGDDGSWTEGMRAVGKRVE
ncbi:hypothetical protein Mal64_27530 [Pseudobythopirellula maris]|uniref:DUF1579 domain-containing protein n=1 Tax=Pseudobythopirellula maris TaxID=2527991 RepID=A0A5C5ZJB4_9BACT|nr:DUF1579 domain-containing protein [Pseudobythopirellula maris]TWT87215.1 hypothetical protein Mal64_27530 [Pseudobythopirellula maris]